MPTKRTRTRRSARGALSEFQEAVLLEQPLPEERTEQDSLWLVLGAKQTNPAMAWWDPPGAPEMACAIVLWLRHRHTLLGEWRRLHGRRKHPCDYDPPRLPRGLRHDPRDWRTPDRPLGNGAAAG